MFGHVCQTVLLLTQLGAVSKTAYYCSKLVAEKRLQCVQGLAASNNVKTSFLGIKIVLNQGTLGANGPVRKCISEL